MRPLLPSVVHWMTSGHQGRMIGISSFAQDLIRIAEAIQRTLDGEEGAGGFVSAMAKGDYASAFRNADPINAANFGALMEYRLYYAEDHRS